MSLRRVSVAVALALLASLAGGFLDEYVHTDDGCAFETHCLACQRHVSSVAVVAPSLATPVVLEAIGNPPAPPSGRVLPAPIRHEAPRGPPLV
jgi:hypothetical protein